jgi:hypothetical protein
MAYTVIDDEKGVTEEVGTLWGVMKGGGRQTDRERERDGQRNM